MSKLEQLFDLRRQYASQRDILKNAKLVQVRKEKDPSGTEREILSIEGLDQKEYPLPSYEDIVARLLERKEFMEVKADQGFIKLLLVPFGMGFQDMVWKFRDFLLANKGKIPSLDEEDPLFVWDGFDFADMHRRLIYDPKVFAEFDPHHGKTKYEILNEQREHADTFVGWRVLLVQANQEGIKGVPRHGAGIVEGTKRPRRDIEAGKIIREYLQDQLVLSVQEDSPYYGESGMTLEEWIVAFITNLVDTGRLLDCPTGVNAAPFLTGAYVNPLEPSLLEDGTILLSSYADIPYALMDAHFVRLSMDGPDFADETAGARFAVRV